MKKLLVILTSVSILFTAQAQNVGIGTLTPAEKLDVAGNIKLTGEIKPGGVSGQSGQVLTSNGNGTMQWSMSAPGASEEGNDGWGDCSIYHIDKFFPV